MMSDPEVPEDDQSYYAGEEVIQPVQRWTDAEKLTLLDSHPMFTGRCPNCETPIPFGERSLPKCRHCGWSDDSEISL
ncbi:hypothetical protein [Leptolyngbya sp. AN10]|uniref:hypothetical protein n=1 Tax=Leptolyngbya sp. AN10 TaxID=3423365 RepID=UPI003D314727